MKKIVQLSCINSLLHWPYVRGFPCEVEICTTVTVVSFEMERAEVNKLPAWSTTQKFHGAPLNIMPFQLRLNKVCVFPFQTFAFFSINKKKKTPTSFSRKLKQP